MQTVLVVDDEPQIAQIARDYLERAGFAVMVAGDGRAAIRLAEERRPDLVVLDLGLPGMDGLDVARALTRESGVAIIMLTARVDEADRLRGLDAGADDYVTKPFSPRELVARVRAVLRRTRPDGEQGNRPGVAKAGDGSFRAADLIIDVPRMRVERDGRAIDLTATEFQLLAALARQPGRIFTRGQLLDAVQGSEVDAFERAIDTHVKNIRRKLEPDSRKPRYVLTVYGIGYRFAEP